MFKLTEKIFFVLLAAALVSGIAYLVVEKTSLASALGPGGPGRMGAPGGRIPGQNLAAGTAGGHAFDDYDDDGNGFGSERGGFERGEGHHGSGFGVMGLAGMLKNTVIFAVVIMVVVGLRRLFARNKTGPIAPGSAGS